MLLANIPFRTPILLKRKKCMEKMKIERISSSQIEVSTNLFSKNSFAFWIWFGCSFDAINLKCLQILGLIVVYSMKNFQINTYLKN